MNDEKRKSHFNARPRVSDENARQLESTAEIQAGSMKPVISWQAKKREKVIRFSLPLPNGLPAQDSCNGKANERGPMSDETKAVVSKEETFDKLEIRLGQIVDVQPELSAPKAAYRLTVDFGKFGRRISVGRFTGHAIDELRGQKVLGVLNFEPRLIGDVVSEALILGVQYPKADSGEATFIVPLADAKIGGKLF